MTYDLDCDSLILELSLLPSLVIADDVAKGYKLVLVGESLVMPKDQSKELPCRVSHQL